ncbi:MAG: type IV pili methyl-accepting chemotaxis transducer N-terminal domain-containing protein [Rhodoferax sp.]
MFRTRRFFLALGALWTTPTCFAAPPLSARQAINRSGQLRMLSQRVVKNYLQLGMGILPGPSSAALRQSATTAQGNLVALRNTSIPDPAGEVLATLEQAWSTLRERVLTAPSRDEAAAVARHADTMLAEAEKLTLLLEKATGSELGRAVNLAGRQRMLSQRVAKCYFLHSWGVSDAQERQRLAHACQEFSQGLVQLRAVPGNTEDIRSRIDMLEYQWGFMSAAFTTDKLSAFNPTSARNVAVASDNVLSLAEDLTNLYEALPG